MSTGFERSRTLIVHKDDAGYGLTLSGDKPTRVQTVKTGGASDRAGVREGDVIIKVVLMMINCVVINVIYVRSMDNKSQILVMEMWSS